MAFIINLWLAASGLHIGGVPPLRPLRLTPVGPSAGLATRALAPRAVATPLSQPAPQLAEDALKVLYDGQCMVRATCPERGRLSPTGDA